MYIETTIYFLVLQRKEAPFKVILTESLGIKILNSISSHSSTDLKIKSTFDSLISNLNEVIPKESKIRAFPIHSGGGTFEIIVKNDYNNILTPEKVNEILNKVNSNQIILHCLEQLKIVLVL